MGQAAKAAVKRWGGLAARFVTRVGEKSAAYDARSTPLLRMKMTLLTPAINLATAWRKALLILNIEASCTVVMHYDIVYQATGMYFACFVATGWVSGIFAIQM